MSIEHYQSAELDPKSLEQLQQLESKLGVVLVALEHNPEPATLDSNQLELVKALEQKMGKVLVAYQAH